MHQQTTEASATVEINLLLAASLMTIITIGIATIILTMIINNYSRSTKKIAISTITTII